jgi:hypothetical protein
MDKSHRNADVLSDKAITEIVTENLPKWKSACQNADASCVILTQGAFKKTDNDLFLLAVAIKYAGIAKKDVMISWK